MIFGRVLGNAVCTIKYTGLEGVKLLTVQPVNRRLEPVGTVQVAADVVQAGPGDLVTMVRAREAALALEITFVPVDLTIVGIVDELTVRDQDEIQLRPGYSRYT